MTMSDLIRKEARLIILKALNEQPDGRLNSELLRVTLEAFGIMQTRDFVHDELGWLENMGAVKLNEAGTTRIAALTIKGRDHVEKRIIIEGVKRPSAEL